MKQPTAVAVAAAVGGGGGDTHQQAATQATGFKVGRNASLPSIGTGRKECVPVLMANNRDLFLDGPDPVVGKDHWRLRMDASQRLMHSPVCLYDIGMRDKEQHVSGEGNERLLQNNKAGSDQPEDQHLEGDEPEVPAFSKLVDWTKGVISWAPCVMVGKVIPGLYVISWSHNQKTKIVDRFNLRFPEEMESDVAQELDARLQQAAQLRYLDVYQSNLKSNLP